MIPAGVNAAYQADFRHPWKYCWIGYQGTQAGYYTELIFGKDYVTDISDVTFYEKMIMKALSVTDRRIHEGVKFTPEVFPLTKLSIVGNPKKSSNKLSPKILGINISHRLLSNP